MSINPPLTFNVSFSYFAHFCYFFFFCVTKVGNTLQRSGWRLVKRIIATYDRSLANRCTRLETKDLISL